MSARRRPAAKADLKNALATTAKKGGTIVANSRFEQIGVQHTEHSIRGTVALAQACEATARALLEIARTMNGSNVTTGPCLSFTGHNT